MWRCGAAALFLLALACTGARAEQTVNELLKDYDSAQPAKRTIIEAIVSQTENGISWANVYLKVYRNEKPLSCPPANFALTGSQIIDMLRREAGVSPQIGVSPFGFAIMIVVVKTFPCADKISN